MIQYKLKILCFFSLLLIINSCFQQNKKIEGLKESTSSVESLNLTTIEDGTYQEAYIEQYGDSIRIIELDISDCCIEESNRDNIYGVIQIRRKIEEISISAFIDTELDILPICKKQTLGKKYSKNTIKINQTELYLKNDLNGIDLSLFIPNRIIYIKKKAKTFIVFEMYNFSYTTVGGGYTYIIIQLDQSDKIKSSKIFEYIKEPIKPDVLVKQIEKLF
ncbi:MAG: hypothetical protein ACK5KT_06000 [Dysgonomonas sp.]